MPVFNVTIIQRVTKNIDAAGNEKVAVDRIIVSAPAIVALDNFGAAAAAGTLIPADYDKELLSVTMVRVNQVAA